MYTGNIHLDFEYNIVESVYPCVYREHNTSAIALPTDGGLSLCIQGTSDFASPASPAPRFIPVYTGNMRSLISRNSSISVYPCVYREHL